MTMPHDIEDALDRLELAEARAERLAATLAALDPTAPAELHVDEAGCILDRHEALVVDRRLAQLRGVSTWLRRQGWAIVRCPGGLSQAGGLCYEVDDHATADARAVARLCGEACPQCGGSGWTVRRA